MRTEFTAEIEGSTEDVQAILRGLAENGTRIRLARIQGNPLDVTPLLETADARGPLAAIDMTERAGEVALEHVRAGRLVVADFKGRTASGKTGFTVADVEAIVAENESP